MTTRIFVPMDAAALSVGAGPVAAAVRAEIATRKLDAVLVRNGSRGLLWLEPLLEIETPEGRIGYGPVTASDVKGIFDAGPKANHPLKLGLVEAIPYLAKQQRLTFARCGITDPISMEDYEAHGGLKGLRRALEMAPAAIVQAVADSGLRGRGGAGFPTGIKWKTVLATEASQKYIVCNADEGDSGTFSDRMIMEGDPFALIEGMTIAGIAVGATKGYVYIRSEYPHAFRQMLRAIEIARVKGLLGANVLGSNRIFDMEARLGAGAYICGEETSLLESLEGRRGQIRFKPPLPAIEGLFGKPTVVNN
jgi:formate dehydrogenase iron-sulfur subunit